MQVATPAEFVTRFGGKRVIDKVLVANNGIAAVKCIRSMREWAYDLFGNEKVIKFVVMATPEDLKVYFLFFIPVWNLLKLFQIKFWLTIERLRSNRWSVSKKPETSGSFIVQGVEFSKILFSKTTELLI